MIAANKYVIPAGAKRKAVIQNFSKQWIPASAGMTSKENQIEYFIAVATNLSLEQKFDKNDLKA